MFLYKLYKLLLPEVKWPSNSCGMLALSKIFSITIPRVLLRLPKVKDGCALFFYFQTLQCLQIWLVCLACHRFKLITTYLWRDILSGGGGRSYEFILGKMVNCLLICLAYNLSNLQTLYIASWSTDILVNILSFNRRIEETSDNILVYGSV